MISSQTLKNSELQSTNVENITANEFALHRAWLLFEWVIVCRQADYLGI